MLFYQVSKCFSFVNPMNVIQFQEGDRGILNKANFLQKAVSTPTGTKVTFPSNVRIISVPSGANIVNSTGGVNLNHTALAQKIVTTTNTAAGAQVWA